MVKNCFITDVAESKRHQSVWRKAACARYLHSFCEADQLVLIKRSRYQRPNLGTPMAGFQFQVRAWRLEIYRRDCQPSVAEKRVHSRRSSPGCKFGN